MVLDQAAQRIDGAVLRLQRHAAGARAAGGEARDADGDQRQQAAHREAIAFTGEKTLVVQRRTQLRQAARFGFVRERNNRFGRKRAQAGERLAQTFAERAGDILGEAHDPAVGSVGLETETVRNGGRNEDRDRRGERQRRRLEGHFAAAALDQQNLKQIAVPVRADGPVMDGGAR